MAVKAVRVFSEQATSSDELDFYLFSIVASDDGAEYVFPDEREVAGLDQDHIEDGYNRLTEGGVEPESPEDWIEIAAHRMVAKIFDVEEEYETVAKARLGEAAFASEAVEYIRDFESLDNEEDSLFVLEEEDDDEAEPAFEAELGAYSYYALASDEGEVVAAFRVKDGVEELRKPYGWGSQSFEQDEEWDGYSQIIMDKEFIPFYDRMMSDKKDITLDDVKEFRRKES
jgi:hypothetical protein